MNGLAGVSWILLLVGILPACRGGMIAAVAQPVSTAAPAQQARAKDARARLLVRLEGASNVSQLQGKTRSGSERHCDFGWPTSSQILVVPKAEDVHIDALDLPTLAAVQPLPAEGDEWPFLVLSGHHYLVGLLGVGQRWSPREVWVPVDARQVEVQLAACAVEYGTLLLETLDAEGRERGDGLVVWVEDAGSGTPLAKLSRLAVDPWPLPIALPAGEYRLAVDGDPFLDSMHGDVLRPSGFGRSTRLALVAPGETSRIPLTVHRGARLRLRLEGVMTPEDLEGTQRAFGEWTTSSFEYWAERASIGLCKAGCWPLPVLFRYEAAEFSDHNGDYLYAHVKLGSTEISEPLPAGRFRIEASLRGGRVVSQEIELVVDQTTDMTLRFD